MALCACGSSVFFSLLFLLAITRLPAGPLLSAMKAASALVSFYVAKLLWDEIKVRRGDPPGVEQARPLTVDWRIYPWITVGALLNVTTAVEMGGLSCSHIMKYYPASAKQAIAMGVMIQAVSVLSQTLVIYSCSCATTCLCPWCAWVC